jgi:hypothetical protein
VSLLHNVKRLTTMKGRQKKESKSFKVNFKSCLHKQENNNYLSVQLVMAIWKQKHFFIEIVSLS